MKIKYMNLEYFSRTQYNLLYILCGAILGAKITNMEVIMVEIDYVILIIGAIFFIIDFISQIKSLVFFLKNMENVKWKEH